MDGTPATGKQVIPPEDAISVRVKDKSSGVTKVYVVKKGTDAREIIERYEHDSGKKRRHFKARYRFSSPIPMDDLDAVDGRSEPVPRSAPSARSRERASATSSAPIPVVPSDADESSRLVRGGYAIPVPPASSKDAWGRATIDGEAASLEPAPPPFQPEIDFLDEVEVHLAASADGIKVESRRRSPAAYGGRPWRHILICDASQSANAVESMTILLGLSR